MRYYKLPGNLHYENGNEIDKIPIDILFYIDYFMPVKILDINNPICENTSAVKYKDRLLYNRIIDCIIPYIVSCKNVCHFVDE